MGRGRRSKKISPVGKWELCGEAESPTGKESRMLGRHKGREGLEVKGIRDSHRETSRDRPKRGKRDAEDGDR